MANVHTTLTALFTDIANAIRNKTGDSGTIVADQFPTAIAGIQSGVDTSDATATAEDIAKDKTAYVNGVKLVGTKEDNTPVFGKVSGSTFGMTLPGAAGKTRVAVFILDSFSSTATSRKHFAAVFYDGGSREYSYWYRSDGTMKYGSNGGFTYDPDTGVLHTTSGSTSDGGTYFADADYYYIAW